MMWEFDVASVFTKNLKRLPEPVAVGSVTTEPAAVSSAMVLPLSAAASALVAPAAMIVLAPPVPPKSGANIVLRELTCACPLSPNSEPSPVFGGRCALSGALRTIKPAAAMEVSFGLAHEGAVGGTERIDREDRVRRIRELHFDVAVRVGTHRDRADLPAAAILEDDASTWGEHQVGDVADVIHDPEEVADV